MSPSSRVPPFALAPSPVHGLGVFATRRIRKGTRIIEYTGERISPEEAGACYDDDAMEHHRTYLFQIDDEAYIDAARGGNEARFINHSCDPNCAAFLEDGRVFIEAIRTIERGSELTYDYGLMREGRFDPRWRRLYACWCGSANCRGTMLKPRPKRRRPGEGVAD